MLQPGPNQASKSPSTSNTYTPVRSAVSPAEQANIGASLVIKGEITGSEALYIDGRVEGSIHVNGQRVTIGRSGSVTANINAKEVVIMGAVKGNIQCTERLDIRCEGSLTGDVTSPRVCVEDGAMLKGSVEVSTGSQKHDKVQAQGSKSLSSDEKPKAAAATAGA
jgi:cytoskeletal protein CcmA (bactofilin family)